MNAIVDITTKLALYILSIYFLSIIKCLFHLQSLLSYLIIKMYIFYVLLTV